jgi:hypothetical protein
MTSCHGDTTFLVVPSGLKTGRGPIDGRVTLSRCLYIMVIIRIIIPCLPSRTVTNIVIINLINGYC